MRRRSDNWNPSGSESFNYGAYSGNNFGKPKTFSNLTSKPDGFRMVVVMATKPRYFDISLYYHVYNRGVEKRDVFVAERDYGRFLQTMDFYLYDQRISYSQFRDLKEEARRIYKQLNPKDRETLRVRLISYTLMPNHFHLLLKPARIDGISRFLSDISNSYTRYFNIKNERAGNLFQGTFKSKEISSEESALQVARYFDLNSLNSSETNPDGNLRPEDYPFSSYRSWITASFLNPKGLVELDAGEISRMIQIAGGTQRYREFVEAKIGKDPKLGIEDLIVE